MPLSAPNLIQAISGKAFRVPEGGWNARTFAVHGALLIKTLVRTAKIVQRKAAPALARAANEVFRRQLEKVIEIATRHVRKDPMRELMLPNHEAVWQQAIEQVFRDAGVEIITHLTPPIQSVLAQGYTKTSFLLGMDVDPAWHGALASIARDIAKDITGINETTRLMFQRHITEAIRDGATVAETVKDLRETIPDINAGRQLTIARTELNHAWTKGSMVSFKESGGITHVSVVGCEAREWNGPPEYFYRGEPTCNIKDVPLHDADKLEFHPNHTGVVIPSAFRTAEGHHE